MSTDPVFTAYLKYDRQAYAPLIRSEPSLSSAYFICGPISPFHPGTMTTHIARSVRRLETCYDALPCRSPKIIQCHDLRMLQSEASIRLLTLERSLHGIDSDVIGSVTDSVDILRMVRIGRAVTEVIYNLPALSSSRSARRSMPTVHPHSHATF